MAVIPLFGSKKDPAEQAYKKGLRHLKAGEMALASECFSEAMHSGHVSATYNLSVLWGSGAVTPYDFDAAADCWYKAAAAGNQRAKESLWLIEAADRAGFGSDNLAEMQRNQPQGETLNGHLMICAARFYDACCRKFGATADVIAYELDGAASSDFDFVHAFIARTGVDKAFYDGGLERLIENSAADQITDGLNEFSSALRQSGVPLQVAVMARCSVVGYIIKKSAFGDNAQPLLGVDSFFGAAEPLPDRHPTLQRLCDILEDERCNQFFMMAIYSDKVQIPFDIAAEVQEAMSLAREICGRAGISPEILYQAIQRDLGLEA